MGLVRSKSALSWHVWRPFYIQKRFTAFSARCGTLTIEIRALVASFEAVLHPKTIHSIFCEMWDFMIEIRALAARLEAVLHLKTIHGFFFETWDSYDRNQGSRGTFGGRFTSEKDPQHFLPDVGLVQSKSGLSWHVWRPFYVQNQSTTFSARCGTRTFFFFFLVQW